ncbi:hypothetical protein [Peterkaempfera sp. SMS 1(5)a]|uniref:hypothetical protein n=1 Tax=Peterkaempfera podocarpi TaxID=3232308 RepID=UPI00366B33E8
MALLGWLADERAPRLCRVSGPSGTGSTHLLAWLAAACISPAAPPEQRIHSLLPAAGLTVRSATWLMAGQLHTAARTPEELLASLERDPRPTVVCVGDLDRAGGPGLPDEPRRIVAELLDPLLSLPQVRIVADAATGSPAAAAFTAVGEPAVLELDQPQWTDRQRFAAWYAKLSQGRSAFTADQLPSNPGLAQLAARTAAAAGGPAGPAVATPEAVCAAWWATVPEPARAALRTLAAFDRPVPREAWAQVHGDAQAVREAARLLPAADPAGNSWGLRPLPLPALVAAPQPDRTAMVRTLAQAVPRTSQGETDLAAAGPDRLALLLEQAVSAGIGGRLLTDPLFLVHAHPVAVTAALEAAATGGALAEAWAAAGPALVDERDPAVRAAVLRARLLGRDDRAAEQLGQIAAGVGWEAVGAGWRPAAGSAAEPSGGWSGPVVAATAGGGPHAGQLLLADPSGAVRVVAAADGRPAARIALPGPKPLRALACSPGGSVLLLDSWGAPEVLAPAGHGAAGIPAAFDGGPGAVAAGLEPHHLTAALDLLRQRSTAELSTLACFPGLPQAPPAVGDASGRVQWQDEVQQLHRGPVTALAATGLPSGSPAQPDVPLLVSGGLDGTVRLWGPGAEPMPEPSDARECPVTAVAAAHSGRGLLVAAGWEDGLVRVRLLGEADAVVDLRLGSAVWALALTGAGLLLVGGPDGAVTLRIGG